MFSLILILIIIGCLVAIGVILFRKFPKVAAINLKTTPVIKQLEVKRRLLEERLQRKFSNTGNKTLSLLKPLGKLLGAKIKSWCRKISELEEEYRQKVLKSSFKDKIQAQQYANRLLSQAEELIRQDKLPAAEKKYIEILTLDEKNVTAYKGLGELYLKQKDYEHARETFEFLLKLNEDDPFVYRSLGEISLGKGDLKKAQEQYLRSLELDAANIATYLDLAEVYLNLDEADKAFEITSQAAGLEPLNPRILDFLIEVSIIVRDKEAALKAFHQLKESNPENQKLAELKEKIDKL